MSTEQKLLSLFAIVLVFPVFLEALIWVKKLFVFILPALGDSNEEV